MIVRISHCSNSLKNYYVCLSEKVAGFLNRGPKSGELIYLSVKIGKKSFCGARFILDEITDYKPWEDSEKYITAFKIKDIEYCKPFDISILSGIGGKYWALKYLQGAKPINDNETINLLNKTFTNNKTKELIPFEENINDNLQNEPETELETENSIEDESEIVNIIQEVPEARINIKGTFQIVNFINETDKVKGLEVLVNQNFHSLFSAYSEKNSILIPENRIFMTKGFKNEYGENIQGIRSIPDAILITLDKGFKNSIQISLIEYECYGENKSKETDKLKYLNSQIIPQLMRFASAFSVTTEEKTREKTIQSWSDKILKYINADEVLCERFIGWIKELNPDIKERAIDREIEKMLIQGFKNGLRVMLIIDELSTEQKSMIKNVINSFKLENGDSIQFLSYIVRLVQNINNNEFEYGLTVQ